MYFASKASLFPFILLPFTSLIFAQQIISDSAAEVLSSTAASNFSDDPRLRRDFRYEGGLNKSSITVKGCGIGRRFYVDSDKIVGGQPVSIADYPWQVSLRTDKFSPGKAHHYCGGSILNSKWVLTAAHCVVDFKPADIKVQLGSSKILWHFDKELAAEDYSKDGSPKVTAVKAIHAHSGYDTRNLVNDIALLELKNEVPEAANLEVPLIQGVCLPSFGEEFDGVSTVSGWGKTSESGSPASVLQAVDVKLMSDDQCSKFYGSGKIYSSMVCAGYPSGGRDSCQGDSGGPLVKAFSGRYVQVGVVSWGYGCARPGNPGVYTQVSKFIPWIRTTILKHGPPGFGFEGESNNVIAVKPTTKPAAASSGWWSSIWQKLG